MTPLWWWDMRMLWFYHKIVGEGPDSILLETNPEPSGNTILAVWFDPTVVWRTPPKIAWTERSEMRGSYFTASLYYSWTLGPCAPNGRNIPCKFVWQITHRTSCYTCLFFHYLNNFSKWIMQWRRRCCLVCFSSQGHWSCNIDELLKAYEQSSSGQVPH